MPSAICDSRWQPKKKTRGTGEKVKSNLKEKEKKYGAERNNKRKKKKKQCQDALSA